MSSEKSSAGPPPYTITCEPQPNENPNFNPNPQPGPSSMGWCATPPGPAQPEQMAYQQMPQPFTPGYTTQVAGVHQTPNMGSASVVYVSQQPHQVVVSNLGMPKHSTHMTCPSCRNITNTNVQHKANTRTHIWSLCLCIWGFWLCCLCLAPYCMNSCKNSEHYCSNCGAYVGTSL